MDFGKQVLGQRNINSLALYVAVQYCNNKLDTKKLILFNKNDDAVPKFCQNFVEK